MPLDQLANLSPAAYIIVGAVLLLAGRKLFWLFVAVVGFLFGLKFGAEVAAGTSQIVILGAAIALGLIGALAAIFLQKIAVAIAGGAAGGLLAMRLAADAGMAAPIPIIAFVLIGIIAAVLAIMLFDWALIILSSLTGASMIVESTNLDSAIRLVVMIVLAVVGIAVQARLQSRSRVTSS